MRKWILITGIKNISESAECLNVDTLLVNGIFYIDR